MIIPQNSFPVSNGRWPKDILNLEEQCWRTSLPWAWWKASHLSASQHPTAGLCVSCLDTLKMNQDLWLLNFQHGNSSFFLTAGMIKLWQCSVCSDHLTSYEDALRLTSSEDLLQFIWLSWALKAYLWENSRVSKGVFTSHHCSWLLKVIQTLFPILRVILAFNNSMFKNKRVVIIKTQINCKYLYV